MVPRIEYDEFGLFAENAEEFGLPYDGPPAVRRATVQVAPGRSLSALVWGDGEPQLVLLHGGAQNAHTWDTVAMALGCPLVAVDLPGHGHSDGPGERPEGQLSAVGNAQDVAVAVHALAPEARAVVGMSLGGLTAVGLAAHAPALVRRLVLVDVTPGVDQQRTQAITAFVNGPATFRSFEDLLARTIEHNPTRTVASLRRGILHNAVQLDDGSWVWRYRRHAGPAPIGGDPAVRPDFGLLWEALEASDAPVLLVRGMRPQSVVRDEDEAELKRRRPDAEVLHFAEAGHSVQGDMPLELAAAIARFCGLDA